MIQPDRPEKTQRRMRTACWLSKATDTHSKHGNDVYANAPQSYVMRALSVSLIYANNLHH